MKNLVGSVLLIVLVVLSNCSSKPNKINQNDIDLIIVKISPSKEHLSPLEIIINFQSNTILINNNNLDLSYFLQIPKQNNNETEKNIDSIINYNKVKINPENLKFTKEELSEVKGIINNFTSDELKDMINNTLDGMAVSFLVIRSDNKVSNFVLINDFSDKHILLIKKIFLLINNKSSNIELLKKYY